MGLRERGSERKGGERKERGEGAKKWVAGRKKGREGENADIALVISILRVHPTNIFDMATHE